MPTVKRPAWYAFSEMIIQTLLCSNDVEETSGVKTKNQPVEVIAIKFGIGNVSVCPRKTPVINTDASSLNELIGLNQFLSLP